MSTIFVGDHDFSQHFVLKTKSRTNQHGVAVISKVIIANIELGRITSDICDLVEPLDKSGDLIDGYHYLILGYCIHILLISTGIYRHGSWNIVINSDYHAQTVDSVKIVPKIAQYIDLKLLELQDMTDFERISFALETMYSIVLPELHDKRWEVKAVQMSDLLITNPIQFKKCQLLNSKSLQLFDGYSFPRAITLYDNDTCKYHVYDGYRQLAQAPKVGKFLVIVGYDHGESSKELK